MILELTCVALAALGGGLQDDDPNDLAERYRQWIEMEVPYIISEQEREYFYQLTSNAQRDRFIKEFWEQRDPTPGTEKNEFKEEHYRRIEYANKWLGRESPKPGWKTARGKIYIQLGEPKQKRAYHSHQRLHPQEIWFYDADPQMGVPPFFYVIFFKKFGVGDYVLYDPTLHGPESLVFLNAGTANEMAPQIIAQYDLELAQASLSLVPTEMADIENYRGRPSLSSIQLMAQLENMPNYRRDATYAERILKGEPKVETLYAFDQSGIPMDMHVVRMPDGSNVLNYSFYYPAPRMEVGEYDGTVYSALDVIFSVMNDDGIALVNQEVQLDEEYSDAEKNMFRRSGYGYEGHVLVLPGNYDVTLTVRNRVSKVFYSTTKSMTIPFRTQDELAVLPPILYPRAKTGVAFNPGDVQPYQFSELRMHPLLHDKVQRGQEFGIFHQVMVPQDLRDPENPVRVTYAMMTEKGTVVAEKSVFIGPQQYDSLGTASLVDKFATTDLGLGTYKLEITVNAGGREQSVTSRGFTLDGESTIQQPLERFARGLDFTGVDPIVAQAEQLIAIGRKAIAVQLLKKEVDERPAHEKLNGLYARALAEDNKLEEAIDVLLELTLRFPEKVEWRRELGMLYLKTGNYNKAIGHLERVRQIEGNSIDVLNPLGEAYSFAGNPAKAQEIWRLSLDIENNQPLIQSRLDQNQ